MASPPSGDQAGPGAVEVAFARTSVLLLVSVNTEVQMLLAYIDPAVGSMLLQAAAAILLMASVFCRRFLIAPFIWLFGGRRHGSPKANTTEVSAPAK